MAMSGVINNTVTQGLNRKKERKKERRKEGKKERKGGGEEKE